MFKKSILTESQRKWFWPIAIISIFLTANGFYLWAFDTVDMYYMMNVLAHVIVGLLFAIPFIVYSSWHFWTARRARNWKSKLLGYVLFAVIIGALATGAYLTFEGVRKSQHWVLWIHIIVAFLGVAGFTFHRLTSTRKFKLGKASLYEAAIVLAGFVLLSGVHLIIHSSMPTANASEKDVSLTPSNMKTSTGKYLNGDVLAESESCKDCHPDSYKQWQSSIHAKGGFKDDPFHKATFEYMMRTASPGLWRFCGTCHDPVMIASGTLEDVTLKTDFSKLKYTSTAISCNACHAIQSVDLRGSGHFTLGEPVEYPFAHSTNPVLKFVNYTLMKVKPEAHRNSLTKPFFNTSLMCAACHKLAIPKIVNNYKWGRGQDQYDQWQYSGMSGNHASSWYSAPKPFSGCQECHMSRTPSNEFGSQDGTIPNHWTPGPGTEMAIIMGDSAWLNRDVAFLQNRLSVDVFGAIPEKNFDINNAKSNGSAASQLPRLIAPLNGKNASLAADDPVRIEVVIRTRKIGHNFTEGTGDINEARLEIIGKDANGNVFFRSGEIDPKTYDADSTGHFIRVRLFSSQFGLIDKHNLNVWTGAMYQHAIPPGNAQTVHYKMTIPRSAGDHVTLIAQVHYRKFNNFYTQWALHQSSVDTAGFMHRLPYDVMMAADTVTVKVGGDFRAPDCLVTQDTKLRERFNDYGIGLFNEGDERGAAFAFKHGYDYDTTYADAYINLARIAMNEGNLDEMIADINRADQIKPDFYKAHFFRGLWDKMSGKLDDAIHEFTVVHDRFPLDRQTITNMARIYYLQGNYQTSLEWSRKELAIDPEDFTALYNAALSFRAIGQNDSADHYQNIWEAVRPDERSPEFAKDYRVDHPVENNESNPIHEHLNSMLVDDLKRKLPPKKMYSETK